jgi:hypothetical protein
VFPASQEEVERLRQLEERGALAVGDAFPQEAQAQQPPNHFNCRSIVSPVVVGEQLDESEYITVEQKGKARELADARFLAIHSSAWAAYAGRDWDESEHPRHPAGSPKGGEFASKYDAKELALLQRAVSSGNTNEFGELYDEEGKLVLAKRGGRTAIVWKESMLQRDYTLLHTHPNGGTLSPSDIRVAYQWGLREIRAVGIEDGRAVSYRLQTAGRGLPVGVTIDQLAKAIQTEARARYIDWEAQAPAKVRSDWEATNREWRRITHETVAKASSMLGWKYERKDLGPWKTQ